MASGICALCVVQGVTSNGLLKWTIYVLHGLEIHIIVYQFKGTGTGHLW